MKKDSLLAVGSIALDSVQTPFGSVRETLGGSAAYFSAGARFFTLVSLVAVVGADFPDKYFRLLQTLGIDTRGIRVEKGSTFRWQGRYDHDLNNARTLKTELNVFKNFRPALSPENKKSAFVFLANIDPEIQHAVLRQVENPRLTACDTMNYWIENKKPALERLLKEVDIFLCNDSEARQLSGETNLVRASRRILSHGPGLLVIKKGEHGVLCFSRHFTFLAPAFLLEKVFDPTGAGDAFAGGFLGHLIRSPRVNEQSVRQAVIYGSVLASYNVESFGLKRLAALKRPEIERRFQLFKNMTRF